MGHSKGEISYVWDIVEDLRHEFRFFPLRNLVMQLAFSAQKDLNAKIKRIYFRKMKTKWASYSQNSNLTVNTRLRFLPEELIRYIIHHETTHSLERKHNEKFWTLISKEFPEHQTNEGSLLTFWFLIQKEANQEEDVRHER